jgi:sulfur-carrier protein
LFASLRRFAPANEPGFPLEPGSGFEVELPEGGTLGDLLSALEIPSEETRVAFVNGNIRDLDWELKTGDELGLFPPIGGGQAGT